MFDERGYEDEEHVYSSEGFSATIESINGIGRVKIGFSERVEVRPLEFWNNKNETEVLRPLDIYIVPSQMRPLRDSDLLKYWNVTN